MLTLDEIAERLERALLASPADETELVWIEASRGHASSRGRRSEARLVPQRTVHVRVLDRGRVGSYRTVGAEGGELDDAVRQAIAQSRVRDPVRGLAHLAPNEPTEETPDGIFCPQLAALDGAGAGALVQRLRTQRELLTLDWAHGRVAVYSSRGIRRSAEVTAAAIEVRAGRRPGGGWAADAGRRLEALDGEAVTARAHRRHAAGDTADLPTAPLPAALSPEATGSLVQLLNQSALTASCYADGDSLLRRHLGVQVFDRTLDLWDDGTDPQGLPFPFDLEGTPKRRIDLILKGTLKTPALDQRQAARLGLPPTAHAIGGNDARASNLFLQPGDLGEEALLAAVGDGLWISRLQSLEITDAQRLQFRAIASGLRRIHQGRLAEGLPDAVWEDSLLRAFSDLPGIGADLARLPAEDPLLGGITTPGICLASLGPLTPADT